MGGYQEVDLCERKLARLAKKCQELPGQELLKYQDGPETFKVIESGDVNQYLREITGEDFTAKDFRTWGATVFATAALHSLGPAASDREGRKKVTRAIKETASKLGNTPAICRKYYVDPKIIDAYLDGKLFEVMNRIDPREARDSLPFGPEERAVFDILKDSQNGRRSS